MVVDKTVEIDSRAEREVVILFENRQGRVAYLRSISRDVQNRPDAAEVVPYVPSVNELYGGRVSPSAS